MMPGALGALTSTAGCTCCVADHQAEMRPEGRTGYGDVWLRRTAGSTNPMASPAGSARAAAVRLPVDPAPVYDSYVLCESIHSTISTT